MVGVDLDAGVEGLSEAVEVGLSHREPWAHDGLLGGGFCLSGSGIAIETSRILGRLRKVHPLVKGGRTRGQRDVKKKEQERGDALAAREHLVFCSEVAIV